MKMLRPWATPLTIATTLVTVVSGVLLFFHFSPGLTRVAHEWIGLLMVAAVVLHLVLNYRAFLSYFRRPAGALVMALGLIVTVASLSIPTGDGAAGAGGMRAAVSAMEMAYISELAAVADRNVDDVLADLAAAGYPARADQTPSALSGGAHEASETIIGVIFSR